MFLINLLSIKHIHILWIKLHFEMKINFFSSLKNYFSCQKVFKINDLFSLRLQAKD